MDGLQWKREAERYAQHRYCYPQIVDDLEDSALDWQLDGRSPYDWVEAMGDKYGLDRTDIDWGINSDKTFEKAVLA